MTLFSRGSRSTAAGGGHSVRTTPTSSSGIGSSSFFHPHPAAQYQQYPNNSNKRTTHRVNHSLTGHNRQAPNRWLRALVLILLALVSVMAYYMSSAGFNSLHQMYRYATEDNAGASSAAVTPTDVLDAEASSSSANHNHVRSTKADPVHRKQSPQEQQHQQPADVVAAIATPQEDDVERLSEAIEGGSAEKKSVTTATTSSEKGDPAHMDSNSINVDPIEKEESHSIPVEEIIRQHENSNENPAVEATPPQEEKIIRIRPFLQTKQDFAEHRLAVQAALKDDQLSTGDSNVFRKVITAYLEPPLNDTIPGTGDRGDLTDPNAKDFGTPPDFVVPLPLRTWKPQDLQIYQYPRVKTCHDLPGKFPVDRGLQLDQHGQVVVWNVGKDPTPPDFPQQEAPYCPVESDPFLPWIHDFFPSSDGTRIEFVGQNKRRCRTGSMFTENVDRLVPQVALMQPVSVAPLSEDEARKLAPTLWHPDADDSDSSNNTTRYRLVPLDEASPDGKYTRFVCRFHTTTLHNGAPQHVLLGETLSNYPFNYEFVSYRKNQKSLLSPKGKDTMLFWSSNLHFSCPLPPNNLALQEAVASGTTVLDDGTPTLYVDVAPIRTSARYMELHLDETMIGPVENWELPPFDATRRWGPNQVLPRFEASGRWANLPICRPPELTEIKTIETEMDMDTFETVQVTRQLVPDIGDRHQHSSKPHFLSACLWASTEFKTRGKVQDPLSDTHQRLQEWMEFHLMVGFDHVYLYDNSAAHTNASSLAGIVDLFPGRVTHIDWPSTVCNNNIPAHDSTGERSSQYAAENACRIRYGPFSEWMAVFDTDEYFVPMGNYTNLKDVLRDAEKGGTNILSMRSSRGKLRTDKSIEIDGKSSLEKSADATFLEAYNCDSAGTPKPSWAERARKQIFKTDYVMYHYVHYASVTQGLLETYQEAQTANKSWQRYFGEKPPSERNADEVNEIVLVHTKTTESITTWNYKTKCRFDYEKKWQGCYVAVPWPANMTAISQENASVLGLSQSVKQDTHDENGLEYNCWINKRVEDYYVPKLREALAKRKT